MAKFAVILVRRDNKATIYKNGKFKTKCIVTPTAEKLICLMFGCCLGGSYKLSASAHIYAVYKRYLHYIFVYTIVIIQTTCMLAVKAKNYCY